MPRRNLPRAEEPFIAHGEDRSAAGRRAHAGNHSHHSQYCKLRYF